MGVFKVIKNGVTAGWNISAWMGMSNIKKNAEFIKIVSKEALTLRKTQEDTAPKGETFEQAIRRLNLTEEALQKRIKASGQIIFLCGLLIIPMLGYTWYMFISHFYLPSFVCLMLTALLGAYCFREHFNRFQMRQRRLGCSFHEWFTDTYRTLLTRKK